MKQKRSVLNERIFSSKEISGIGAAKILKGKAARVLNFIGRSFAYSSTRSYGCFLLSFGLFSLLLHLGEYYFMDQAEVAIPLVTGAALTVLSVPLLIFDKPMCVALQDFSVTDYLLFEFLSIKRMHRNVTHVTVSPILAVFLGFIPAIVGFFLPIQWVLLALAILVTVVVAFTTPEFPMLLMLLILPYLPVLPSAISEIIIISVSVIMLLSFALKVAIGKRVCNFDIYDILIGLIILFVFIGGIAGYGSDSLKNSLLYIVLLLGYFPAANLIINRRLADCAINAVIISSVPITVLAIIEFFVEINEKASLEDYTSPSGVSVFFGSSSTLAAFLLVASLLSVSFFIQKKNKFKKAFYLTVFIAQLFALGLIMQPAAWLSLIVASLAYLVINSRKVPADILIFLFALPHLILLIPTKILDTVSGFLGIAPSFSEKLHAYEKALSVFLENIWLGVGIGDASYKEASGGAAALFNNILGIGVELGIIVLVLFLLTVILRLRHISYYRTYVRTSHVRVSDDTTALVMIALLVFGIDAHVFADTTLFYLFWVVFGICTSTLRTAKKEYDDRLSYYGDSRSAESSVIDVQIQG